jgi:predicted kinase
MTRRVRPSAVATRRQTQALAASVPDVVATLRAQVPAPAVPHGSPALVLMMGFPGVGKSHCARLLAARLTAAHVASDHLRSQLFVAASYAEEENAAVFRIVDGLVERLIEEGHRVVVDATHLRASARESMTALARRRAIPLAHVLVTADESEILARLGERGRARAADDRSDADERVYRLMRARGFEAPGEHLTIRNGPDVGREVDRAARALEARWSAAT